MNITILGTGYVGLVTGTCFAEMGNTVTCVDIDKEKIDNLNKGVIPIYEPGLEELIQQNEKAGRLSFSTSLIDDMKNSNIFLIAVGTPESQSGEANMEYVYNVAHEIGKNLERESIVIDKSTVPVGTADKEQSNIADENHGENIHGNLFEALIGAIFLDSGCKNSYMFIEKFWGPHIDEIITVEHDPKTQLQEISQKKLTRLITTLGHF